MLHVTRQVFFFAVRSRFTLSAAGIKERRLLSAQRNVKSSEVSNIGKSLSMNLTLCRQALREMKDMETQAKMSAAIEAMGPGGGAGAQEAEEDHMAAASSLLGMKGVAMSVRARRTSSHTLNRSQPASLSRATGRLRRANSRVKLSGVFENANESAEEHKHLLHDKPPSLDAQDSVQIDMEVLSPISFSNYSQTSSKFAEVCRSMSKFSRSCLLCDAGRRGG